MGIRTNRPGSCWARWWSSRCFRSSAVHFNVPTFLGKCFPTVEVPEDFILVAISVASGLVGIAIAYVMYVAQARHGGFLRLELGGLYTLVYNK